MMGKKKHLDVEHNNLDVENSDLDVEQHNPKS
jgi:hypothetical protein